MTELIRSIEKEDIPKLKLLLAHVFDDSNYIDIERLGGMTNHSYRITRADHQEYLVRIPGEGTEEIINRRDERKSTELACKLNIDSELLYFDDDGCKVMRYISNPQPMSNAVMQREEVIRQAADIFHRLHTCGEDTGVRFNVFEMADLYEHVIRENGIAVHEDYEQTKQTVMEIKKEIDSNGSIPRVPCHNDSLIGNWILDADGRLYLVDWEYSGMNEAMWDLSCLSIEAEYSADNDKLLLETYYRRDASLHEKKYFVAAKIYVDYLWTLWGLTRVPFDGVFMQNYADTRYNRLKRNMSYYQTIK